MSRLETKFLGITFPNPFLLAAGPPTARGAIIIKAFKAGWGGAVLKTIALEPTEPPSPRVYVIKSGRDKRGMVDIELFTDLTLDRWEEELDVIRASYPERPIIASVDPGSDTWDLVERAGAGFCVLPEAPPQLAESVLQLEQAPGLRKRLGEKGRDYVLKYHSPEYAAKAFESLLLEALEPGK